MKYALQYKEGMYGKVWWTKKVTDDPIEAIEFGEKFYPYSYDEDKYIHPKFSNIQLAKLPEGKSLYSSKWLRWKGLTCSSVRRVLSLNSENIKNLRFRK